MNFKRYNKKGFNIFDNFKRKKKDSYESFYSNSNNNGIPKLSGLPSAGLSELSHHHN